VGKWQKWTPGWGAALVLTLSSIVALYVGAPISACVLMTGAIVINAARAIAARMLGVIAVMTGYAFRENDRG